MKPIQEEKRISRELFCLEHLMMADGKGSFNILLSCTLKGEIKLEDVRLAADKMQQKHPQFRAFADLKNNKMVYLEEAPKIPIRVVERHDDVCWRKETERESKTHFDLCTAPLVRITWVRSESSNSSEIILIVPHLIGDGKSIYFLLNELCSLIDNPKKEVTPNPHLPNIKELVPNVKLPLREKIKGHFLSNLALLYMKIDKIASRNKKQIPIDNFSIFFYVDGDMHEQTYQLIKKHKISLGSLACALLSYACMQVIHVDNKKRVIFYPLDIRRYIPSIKKDMMFPFAPMLRLNVDFSTSDNLIEQAHLLDLQIVDMAIKKKEVKIAFIRYPIIQGQLFIEYFKKIVPHQIRRNMTSIGKHDFNFANIGRVHHAKTSNIEVVRIHGGEVYMPWANPTFFGLVEYDNIFGIALRSNKHIISEENMQKIKALFFDTLSQLLQKERDSLSK